MIYNWITEDKEEHFDDARELFDRLEDYINPEGKYWARFLNQGGEPRLPEGLNVYPVEDFLGKYRTRLYSKQYIVRRGGIMVVESQPDDVILQPGDVTERDIVRIKKKVKELSEKRKSLWSRYRDRYRTLDVEDLFHDVDVSPHHSETILNVVKVSSTSKKNQGIVLKRLGFDAFEVHPQLGYPSLRVYVNYKKVKLVGQFWLKDPVQGHENTDSKVHRDSSVSLRTRKKGQWRAGKVTKRRDA